MHERDAEAVLLLADSLIGVGKSAEAAELLRGLATLRRDDVRARRLLTRALLDIGDYAAAEPIAESLAGAAKGAELPPAVFFYAYALWGQGRLDECGRQIERYAAILADGQCWETKERETI